MAPTTSPSPLEMVHILNHTLSYASPQTLGRCMAVSSEWYDAAARHLWAHISYRVNPYLRDPGVTPFLPVPPGDQFCALRRAKRRAVRYVRVVEMRRHDCGQVGCQNMTLHGDESEDGSEGGSEDEGNEENRPARPCRNAVLSALRLHIEDNQRTFIPSENRPRIIPFPCPFVSQLDTTTMVITPLRHLSTTRPIPLPSPPSLRKLVILLIPPTQAPGEYRIADTVPASVDEIVVYLWRRHAASSYDNFRGAWSSQMGQKRWGPDKIWGHWCNFILACSSLGLERPSHTAREVKRVTRRFTFVGTGGVDPLWLDLADPTQSPQFPGQDSGADPAMYGPTQDRFEKGLRACLVAKAQERRRRYTGEGREYPAGWEAQLNECLENVRFLSREQYLAEGKWYGEFTTDEVMYHG